MGMENGLFWVRASGTPDWEPARYEKEYNDGRGCWWVLGWDCPVYEDGIDEVGPALQVYRPPEEKRHE